MTLILGTLSTDAVVLVADRRITGLDGRVYDENRNKLVLFNEYIAFGFSGLAVLEGVPVDQWLAAILRSCANLDEAITSIVARADEAFSRLPAGIPKHQAFVGAGWARQPGKEMEPVWLVISNAWDKAKQVWCDRPSETFTAAITGIRPGKRWLLCPAVGVRLSAGEINKARRLVRPAMKRQTRGIVASRLLGQMVQHVSERARTVGSSATCVVLPRPQAAREYRVLMPPAAVAGRIPGLTAFDLVQRGVPVRWNPPIVVVPGLVVVPEVRLGEDGRFISMTTKVSKAPGYSGPVPQFGIGVTDGAKESAMVVGPDGKPQVVEKVVAKVTE